MSRSLRIATWNLHRPKAGGWKYNPQIMEKIRDINADIWVLTETHDVIDLAPEYVQISSPSIPVYHKPGEHCATIWSRYAIKRELKTFDPSVTVGAEIETPYGLLLVYGTIIVYAREGVFEGIAQYGELHRDSSPSITKTG